MRKILIQEGIPDETVDWPSSVDVQRFGHRISSGADCELLIVRANFYVSEALLDSLPGLQALAVVSTGIDNVPVRALRDREIAFRSAAGTNARGVRDYVVQALLGLYSQNPAMIDRGVGIVGLGRVGRLVQEFLIAAEIDHAYYDPLLDDPGNLPAVIDKGVVTFHTPLTSHGAHSTENMLSTEYFSDKSPLIIQTARGGIWQDSFYHEALQRRLIWAQDVYPEEPPGHTWVNAANYSTPHIAGYTMKGRHGGLHRVLAELLPEARLRTIPPGVHWGIADESSAFKRAPESFDSRRLNFPLRNELRDYPRDERESFAGGLGALPPEVARAIWI